MVNKLAVEMARKVKASSQIILCALSKNSATSYGQLNMPKYIDFGGYVVLHGSKYLVDFSNLRFVLEVDWSVEVRHFLNDALTH